jgi:hypothetical protein
MAGISSNATYEILLNKRLKPMQQITKPVPMNLLLLILKSNYSQGMVPP